jgi:hypothetical protein
MRRCKKERKSSRGWVVFVLQMGIGSFKMSECLGIHKRKRKGKITRKEHLELRSL